MRVKKGRNYQPIAIPQGFTQSGQVMERPGLTVAHNAVTLIPVVGRGKQQVDLQNHFTADC